MPPRRIAQIIATLDRAGAEKQLSLLATGLPRDEFVVHVLALTRGGPYEQTLRDAGIPVTVLHKRGKLDPLAFWQARRWLKRLQPDLVQTWMFTANAYGRAAALAAGLHPLVAAERCADPWKQWLQLAIDRTLARRTDRIVVNSPGVRDFYVAAGIAADKFTIIPNGVPAYHPSGGTRAELLAELKLPADARLIVLVGRLWPQKRVKDAIWAADLLKVIRGDVHLIIIGDGPQRDDLVRYRDQCEIQDRVHFLGARPDAMRFVERADLLWLTSAYEGLPNSVMEAMAAGVPVVATDIPGVRDLIIDGQHGLLVPVGDRAGLARCANRLLESPELHQRLGAAGRERMTREFSVEAMVKGYAELYRGLL
ncbi:MAG: glycosyltransferase [Planctomycetia bacterium]|nr:glycosyltransferase [Planctomycetia bacterium]